MLLLFAFYGSVIPITALVTLIVGRVLFRSGWLAVGGVAGLLMPGLLLAVGAYDLIAPNNDPGDATAMSAAAMIIVAVTMTPVSLVSSILTALLRTRLAKSR